MEGLAQQGAVFTLGIWETIDATEIERLVANIELLESGQAGAHHNVALGAGLEGAALAEIQDALEHVPCLAAHCLETVVSTVEKLLLSLQIWMVRHNTPLSPGGSGKRRSLGEARRPLIGGHAWARLR